MALPKAYDPGSTEDRIYQMWEESGAFQPDPDAKETFTISMPPPNATGQLHLGHAVMLALEDIFIRFNRMQGKAALWVPGTDHAAIATESVVIKKIKKEEKISDPRAKLGREELVKRIAHFVEGSQDTIRSQVRKMGSSCDWSREAYTMDPSLNRCVNEVFVKMYNDGLIYRGSRVVNWDTALQTTISDDEIEYKDTEALLYTFEYLSAEQTGGEPLYVASSRPETKLGDTALAVYPDDERYKHLVGKSFDVQWPHNAAITVTVIADHSVNPEFGSGVIGVTPFHSKIDFEMWQRHKNEIKSEPQQVIGEDGRMTAAAGSYAGMPIVEARERFVEGLREQGRLKSADLYMQPLSISYRSKQAVEPLPKMQWFIDVNKPAMKWKGKMMSLKEVMQDTVRSKDISIIPDRFEKTYFNWIDNLQDWCVSRQIWWGHRVPVWYKGEETYVGVQPPPEGKDWNQDNDTLDTWFSSALWTWSTLVDKEKAADFSLSLEDILKQSPDFQRFHPTQVMETGYDIIFFWVARMILMTTYATGQIPFDTVYLHGLIRTRDGKKMSKSEPETMIDPLDMISQYGADALRLSMIVGQSAGNDSRLYEEKIAGYRNFINKLWNASRFVLMQCEEAGIDPASITELPSKDELSLADRALLHELDAVLVQEVIMGLQEYRLSEVGERLYSFIWDFFCDWYLELSKGSANIAVLVHALRRILTLLHPYCPFVTEELWAQVKAKDDDMLISHTFPDAKAERRDVEAAAHLKKLIEVITAIRSLRAEQEIEAGAKVKVILHTSTPDLFEEQRDHLMRLGRLESLDISSTPAKHENAASTFLQDTEVHVPLEGLIDVEKVRASLTKEKEQLTGFLKSVDAKLKNKKFVESAPADIVDREREKKVSSEEKLKKIEERLKSL